MKFKHDGNYIEADSVWRHTGSDSVSEIVDIVEGRHHTIIVLQEKTKEGLFKEYGLASFLQTHTRASLTVEGYV